MASRTARTASPPSALVSDPWVKTPIPVAARGDQRAPELPRIGKQLGIPRRIDVISAEKRDRRIEFVPLRVGDDVAGHDDGLQ